MEPKGRVDLKELMVRPVMAWSPRRGALVVPLFSGFPCLRKKGGVPPAKKMGFHRDVLLGLKDDSGVWGVI